MAQRNTRSDEELFDLSGEADQVTDGEDTASEEGQDDAGEEDGDVKTKPDTERHSALVEDDEDDGDDGEADKAAPEKKPDERSEEEKAEHSRRVQERINALTRERGERDRRIQELEDQLRTSQERQITASTSEVEAKIADVRRELTAAIEAGETQKQIELHEKLAELAGTKRNLEDFKRRREAEAEKAKTAPKAEEQQAENPYDALAPEAKQWVDRNKTWFTDPKMGPYRALALGIDAELTREGMDAQSRAYFDELDRRMKEIAPQLYKAPAKRTESAVAAPDRTPPARRGGKVTLDTNDHATMRRFGLDPKNEEHVKAFASEKKRAG